MPLATVRGNSTFASLSAVFPTRGLVRNLSDTRVPCLTIGGVRTLFDSKAALDLLGTPTLQLHGGEGATRYKI